MPDVWSVLLIGEKKTIFSHENEEKAREHAFRVWRKEASPFELRIYRKRVFRDDSRPSEELLSVWNKES